MVYISYHAGLKENYLYQPRASIYRHHWKPLHLWCPTYLCIRMHDYNFRPVIITWRPFHRLFVRAKRSWYPNASVINTFATFLLLSYWKFTYISFQLLASTDIVKTSGSTNKTQHFYYDASQTNFHEDHLPFALLAITIIATLVAIPPIILCLSLPN